MNLIEQLGGYEKAKEILSRERNSENIDPVIYLNGNEILIDAICDALLEYRRQHNIYEVGDWVYPVAKGSSFGARQITENGEILIYSDHLILNMHHWRHATDEEIKAGKRLEVNQ